MTNRVAIGGSDICVSQSPMKILMSAMACEPGKGSELEVGFRAMLAAARVHEVWVLTNQDSIPALRASLEGRPEAERIHLEGIDFGVDAEGIALLTIPGFHFYYDRWQRKAAARAVELDRQVDFDVVHHVTLAAYWTRAGVAVLDKPLVWGPVGGGVEPPLSCSREWGWRGLARRRRASGAPPCPRPLRPGTSGATPSGGHIRAERRHTREDSHPRSHFGDDECHGRSTWGTFASRDENSGCVLHRPAHSLEGSDAGAARVPTRAEPGARGWSSAATVRSGGACSVRRGGGESPTACSSRDGCRGMCCSRVSRRPEPCSIQRSTKKRDSVVAEALLWAHPPCASTTADRQRSSASGPTRRRRL